MKDIKSYVIGFLSCACLFLIMGQTKADNDDYMQNILGEDYIESMKNAAMQMKDAMQDVLPPVGLYQGFADKGKLYLIDTKTGQLFYEKKQRGEKIWKQMIKPNNRWGDSIRP